MTADKETTSTRNSDLCDSFCPSNQVETLREKVLEVAGLSEIFEALGDATRTKILYLSGSHIRTNHCSSRVITLL